MQGNREIDSRAAPLLDLETQLYLCRSAEQAADPSEVIPGVQQETPAVQGWLPPHHPSLEPAQQCSDSSAAAEAVPRDEDRGVEEGEDAALMGPSLPASDVTATGLEPSETLLQGLAQTPSQDPEPCSADLSPRPESLQQKAANSPQPMDSQKFDEPATPLDLQAEAVLAIGEAGGPSVSSRDGPLQPSKVSQHPRLPVAVQYHGPAVCPDSSPWDATNGHSAILAGKPLATVLMPCMQRKHDLRFQED